MTPVSQLKKWIFALRRRISGRDESILLDEIKLSLGRLENIALQTRSLENIAPPNSVEEITDLKKEITPIVRGHESSNDKLIDFAISCTDDSISIVRRIDFQRISDNLLSNAVSACSVGGKVFVEVAANGPNVHLIVRDNGSGIPPHIQNRIFETDFTTKPGTGSGLGLPVVKKLCDKNGAKVTFRSSSHQGSEFRVEFQKA